MKKIFTILFCSAFVFTSCSNDGEIGPPGPQGPQGPPGEGGELAQVIDITGDFSAENDYTLSLDFNAEDIEVFETDAVLVYVKDGEAGEAGGLPVEIFRPLPQVYYVESGEVQYNYEFTFFQVDIFMEGTANFDELDDEFTQDQVFRVVIVPGEFAENSGVDMSNMNAVLEALDIQNNEISNLQM